MSNPTPKSFRCIYPADSPDPSSHARSSQFGESSADTPGSTSIRSQGTPHRHRASRKSSNGKPPTSDRNFRPSSDALPVIRPPDPYGSSRGSHGGSNAGAEDSRHIHFHHYYAYYMPHAPQPPQPQARFSESLHHAIDDRTTRHGCTPTCLIVCALLLGGAIAVLVATIGLALVGQLLTLPAAVPPTPPIATPPSAGSLAPTFQQILHILR